MDFLQNEFKKDKNDEDLFSDGEDLFIEKTEKKVKLEESGAQKNMEREKSRNKGDNEEESDNNSAS